MKKLIQSLVYWIERKILISVLSRYDEETGSIKIRMIRGRFAIMPSEFIYILTDEYKKATGKGSSAVLYRMGYETGKDLGTVLRTQYKSKSVKKWIKVITRILVVTGYASSFDYKLYGVGKTIDDLGKNPKMRWKVWDHVLSRYLNEGDESHCDWARGWIAGAFSAVTNEDVVCMETQCKADGNPYCEWLLGKRERVIFEGI